MLIVDSQIHIADPGHGSWIDLPAEGLDLAAREAENRSHTTRRNPEAADALREMDRVGVRAAVLVPRGDGAANGACVAAARQHPGRFAVMARVDERNPAHLALVEELHAIPEVLGVRLRFHYRRNQGRSNIDLLDTGGADWLWEALESRSMPIMVSAPGITDHIGALAAAHPSLKITYDHLGIDIDTIKDDLWEVIRPVLDLADYENVAVKASGLPFNTTETYPFPMLRRCLSEVVSAYGAERVFWGSDLSRLPCRYETWIKFFQEELDFLSEGELASIMGTGIVRWLGWKSLLGASDHKAGASSQ